MRVSVVDSCESGEAAEAPPGFQASSPAGDEVHLFCSPEQTAAPEVWDPWAADTSLHPTVSGAQALSPCGHLCSDPSHAQGWL